MRPKFQKRSALKLVGRIIPQRIACWVNYTFLKSAAQRNLAQDYYI